MSRLHLVSLITLALPAPAHGNTEDSKANTFYIVEGNLDGNWGWMKNPLVRTPLKTTLLEPADDKWAHRQIRWQLHRLRLKGYKVKRRRNIETEDLLRILSDKTTPGIFHVGHSEVGELERWKGSVMLVPKDEPLLTVFQNGQVVGLSDELVKNAKTRVNPGNHLKLFYTTACYGKQAEDGLRKRLKLPDTTRYIPAGGCFISTERSVWGSFIRDVKPWIDKLPNRRLPARIWRRIRSAKGVNASAPAYAR
jgi:hypothetical protein